MSDSARFAAFKWLSFDPDKNRYGFLVIVIGCALFLLPLLGLAVINSNQSTRISAQTAPTPTPAPTPPPSCGSECTSMTVTWTRPSAVAQFVDNKGKTASCTSTELTCTVSNVFTPNSTINYIVRVKSATGAVLKSGTALVNPKKQATANWNWTYAVAVYPSSYADCVLAGVNGECLTKVVTNNESRNSVVYSDVKAATEYAVFVCAPNCGEGTVVMQTKQVTPSLPAACVFSPTTLNAGQSLGIITNRFKAGDRPVKIAGRTFGNVVSVGSIPSTGGSVTIPATVPAPQQYDVLVNNGTDVTCVGILQVNPPQSSAPVCKYSGPTALQLGTPISVTHSGFAEGESVRLLNPSALSPAELGKTQTSLGGTMTQSFNLPTALVPGTYSVVIVTRFPITVTTCGNVYIQDSTSSPSPTLSCTYDYNKDGKVDNADVEVLLTHFGESVTTNPNLKIYDLDNNGTIDLNDALALAAKFGSC